MIRIEKHEEFINGKSQGVTYEVWIDSTGAINPTSTLLATFSDTTFTDLYKEMERLFE